MHTLEDLQHRISLVFSSLQIIGTPEELYKPIDYTLSIGGKRLRPLMVLSGCDLFEGDIENALPAAIGIEFLHNFTLLHDDIMDQAPLRRGYETVYKKWDTNHAILSGDTLFALACKKLSELQPDILPDALKLFTRTVIEICEGQQWDMNFESRDDVTIPEYLEMIRLKTAVLLACSLKMGALIAHADPDDADALYEYGINIGMAFQLQDDFLDVFGEKKVFGKEIGGDIVCNKKTFLLLKAFNKAGDSDYQELIHWFTEEFPDPAVKIKGVKDIYIRLGIREDTLHEMEKYYSSALKCLHSVRVLEQNKKEILSLSNQILHRDH
ncbi:MAG: polyprenyl synthetase family protein [Bacteroidota bacterium]|nr:polyprenyl synthetase family protein [Bacteroidota bacterium]